MLQGILTPRLWGILSDSFMKILIPGITVTIPLTVISFSLAMIVAVVCAMVQYADVPVAKQIVRFYVWIFRGTPLLVQLFIIFYGMPSMGIVLDPFPSAVIVFTLNTGAYCTETVRAALESVPVGQMEAGYCVGMSYMSIMCHVILPQAFRTAFPPLSNTLIGLVKDTSLAASITVLEMLQTTKQIVARTYEPMWLYLEVGLIYLAFSTLLTWLQGWGERRLNAAAGKKV